MDVLRTKFQIVENEIFHDAYLSPSATQMPDRYANVFVYGLLIERENRPLRFVY